MSSGRPDELARVWTQKRCSIAPPRFVTLVFAITAWLALSPSAVSAAELESSQPTTYFTAETPAWARRAILTTKLVRDAQVLELAVLIISAREHDDRLELEIRDANDALLISRALPLSHLDSVTRLLTLLVQEAVDTLLATRGPTRRPIPQPAPPSPEPHAPRPWSFSAGMSVSAWQRPFTPQPSLVLGAAYALGSLSLGGRVELETELCCTRNTETLDVSGSTVRAGGALGVALPDLGPAQTRAELGAGAGWLSMSARTKAFADAAPAWPVRQVFGFAWLAALGAVELTQELRLGGGLGLRARAPSLSVGLPRGYPEAPVSSGSFSPFIDLRLEYIL